MQFASFDVAKKTKDPFDKKLKTSAVSTTDGWLTLKFASCVIRQTRSVSALVPFVMYMVFVTWIYEIVVETQFHKLYGRPFAPRFYVDPFGNCCSNARQTDRDKKHTHTIQHSYKKKEKLPTISRTHTT